MSDTYRRTLRDVIAKSQAMLDEANERVSKGLSPQREKRQAMASSLMLFLLREAESRPGSSQQSNLGKLFENDEDAIVYVCNIMRMLLGCIEPMLRDGMGGPILNCMVLSKTLLSLAIAEDPEHGLSMRNMRAIKQAEEKLTLALNSINYDPETLRMPLVKIAPVFRDYYEVAGLDEAASMESPDTLSRDYIGHLMRLRSGFQFESVPGGEVEGGLQDAYVLEPHLFVKSRNQTTAADFSSDYTQDMDPDEVIESDRSGLSANARPPVPHVGLENPGLVEKM